jgi:hypothetical protein
MNIVRLFQHADCKFLMMLGYKAHNSGKNSYSSKNSLTSPAFPSKYFSAKLDLSSEVKHNSSEFKLHSQYLKKGKRLNLTSLKICNLHVEIILQYSFSSNDCMHSDQS